MNLVHILAPCLLKSHFNINILFAFLLPSVHARYPILVIFVLSFHGHWRVKFMKLFIIQFFQLPFPSLGFKYSSWHPVINADSKWNSICSEYHVANENSLLCDTKETVYILQLRIFCHILVYGLYTNSQGNQGSISGVTRTILSKH